MIGDIIKEQRLLQDMTRKELSEGICSEKYIYLIERNERNPSAYILNDLSDRLGIDLFAYYPYLEHDNKDQIYQHRKNFERYSQISDLEKLKAESEQARKLKAFQEEPLIYDIKVVDYTYKILVKGESKNAIEELTAILAKEEIVIDPITLVNAYIVLSTGYQIEGQWTKAQKEVTKAYRMTKNKVDFPRYNTVIISVLISFASLLYNMRDYESLIDFSKMLKEFQEKYSEFNRIYYVDFYLSFAYFHTDKFEKAREHFMRGGYSALLFKNEIDANIITQLDDFKKVSKSLEINPKFIKELYDIL